MSLAKKAQLLSELDSDKTTLDDIESILSKDWGSDHVSISSFEDEDDIENDEDIILVDTDDEDVDSADAFVQIESNDPEEIMFSLPFMPGSDFSEDEIEPELDIDEEEEVEVSEKDIWDWKSGGLSNFLSWLYKMMNSVPGHTGREISGIERAISFLSALDKAISQAVRSDIKNELNIAKIEEARKVIHDGIDRLEDHLETLMAGRKKKKNKKASEAGEIVKEAQKITGVKGIVVTVPLLISRIARVCINGHVSAGHDIEKLFEDQVKRYDLSNREQAETLQLLEDMGYPVRRDRSKLVDEHIDIASSDNGDLAANYYA
jgi:hypothetical protein